MHDPWRCPKCGQRMVQIGPKETFTGDEWREVKCPKCGHEADINTGPALWKVMSDDEDDS